jgi:anti-sigma factor (TIGR02949 family)
LTYENTMTDCRRITERLAAYTDATLPPGEREEVERHLAACPPCRTEASLESGGQRVLRARAEQLRDEPLPPGLRSRCEALAASARADAARTPRSWLSRLVPATLAALAIIVIGGAIFFVAAQRSDVLFAAQLTADHTVCFRGHGPSDAPELDAAQVEAQLASEYGWTLHVPASRARDDIRLVHARRCLSPEGLVPHLLYHVNGEDVSLYVLEGVTRRAADVIAFGHRSRIWTRGDTTFVLVSSASAGNQLEAAAAYLMREAR